MNACLLPGEPKHLPGEPINHVRYVHSLPLDAFRLVHGEALSWPRDLVWAFRRALFQASRDRRIRASSQGLMQDAARLVIRQFEPAVFRMYRDRQAMVLLTDEARDELATALACEMRGNPELKGEVRAALELFRVEITKVNEVVEQISYSLKFNEHEAVNRTINRWLDELEYVREKGQYLQVIHIHKMITDCYRVWDAVLGSTN
jgi:hypothetical protein